MMTLARSAWGMSLSETCSAPRYTKMLRSSRLLTSFMDCTSRYELSSSILPKQTMYLVTCNKPTNQQIMKYTNTESFAGPSNGCVMAIYCRYGRRAESLPSLQYISICSSTPRTMEREYLQFTNSHNLRPLSEMFLLEMSPYCISGATVGLPCTPLIALPTIR
jgi:hypothetical protein